MTETNLEHMGDSGVFRWLLDVRDLWPVPPGSIQPPSATVQWSYTNAAKEALDLLPAKERQRVLRYYFTKDAKLSLGSNLFKRLAIVRTCNVQWRDVVIGEDENRKPCYRPASLQALKMEFNVSHHGTLVALVGCPGEKLQLGVDIVQVNWEKDYPAILKDGFERFASVYEQVFSDREIAEIVRYGTGNRRSEDNVRAWLRHFCAHWCLKEAYIKMTGKALVDPFLRKLEFRNVKVPLPVDLAEGAAETGAWGQTCGDVEIWCHGLRVRTVKMELQAYGKDYIIGTAASAIDCILPPFQILDPAQDIYPSAEMFDDG